MNVHKPTVLCFSGLDPTGGAGLQADIETLFSLGCHCLPVATALTVQNTQNAIAMQTTDAAWLVQQAKAIIEDVKEKALGSVMGGLGGAGLGGSLPSDLPIGTPDLAPTTPQAAAPAAPTAPIQF